MMLVLCATMVAGVVICTCAGLVMSKPPWRGGVEWEAGTVAASGGMAGLAWAGLVGLVRVVTPCLSGLGRGVGMFATVAVWGGAWWARPWRHAVCGREVGQAREVVVQAGAEP